MVFSCWLVGPPPYPKCGLQVWEERRGNTELPDGGMVWLLKGGTLWEDTQAKKSFAMIHSMKSLDFACLKETSVKT